MNSRWSFIVLVVLVVVFVLSYGLFEARRLIEGPQIHIETPKNGSATSTDAVLISGTAHNISFLTINDAPAYTDQAGHFALTLSPPPGYTVFVVAGVDRFGRRTSQTVVTTLLNYDPIR